MSTSTVVEVYLNNLDEDNKTKISVDYDSKRSLMSVCSSIRNEVLKTHEEDRKSFKSFYSTHSVMKPFVKAIETDKKYRLAIGGFIGENEYNINDSFALGRVESRNSDMGGFAGKHSVSTINRSYAKGEVIGVGSFVNHAGGFVGRMPTGNINNNAAGTGNRFF